MDASRRQEHLSLDQIEPRLLQIVSEQLGIELSKLTVDLRIIEDLHCDSLDLVELFIETEKDFGVSLPDSATPEKDPIYKSVFVRSPFRLRDLMELVYLRQNMGAAPPRTSWFSQPALPLGTTSATPFDQLDGRHDDKAANLFEPLDRNAQGFAIHRRATDGMVCVTVPAGTALLGSDAADGHPDERPQRTIAIEAFAIDREPVSTSAYCRFLNSIGPIDKDTLRRWFVPADDDHRAEHLLIHKPDHWQPLPGVERKPMILVSWFGANAYALWAHRKNWRSWESPTAYLPTETQWEYAASGGDGRRYPWGDREPTHEDMRFGKHRIGSQYRPESLPLADVNAELGVSPFGVRHMAGNVWQWCRNTYDKAGGDIRAERGGSWIGPSFLCRTSYRRGRTALARGRCLGFRCATPIEEIEASN